MITYAALSPHPPLIVPVIGRERLKDVEATVNGMRRMARELADSNPDTIVFLTPHGNVFSDCVTALGASELQGDLVNFGSNLRTSRINDLSLLTEIEQQARQSGISFISLDEEMLRRNRLNNKLDHGIMVPLYYLAEAGMNDVPIIAISIGYLSVLELYNLGTVVRDAALTQGKRVAVVASGDMSHRLKDQELYDFHPDGPRFDQALKNMLESGDVISVLNMPEKMRDNAGECGYFSVVIMLGTLDGRIYDTRIFSYEGPFGVGYLTAGFIPGGQSESLIGQLRAEKKKFIQNRRSQESLPVRWARLTLESYIKEQKKPDISQEMEELSQQKAGAFVSLKKNGQLRGCIGTIAPACGDLKEEIARNAISAGTGDPRFPPVDANELEELVYSVDVLGEAESCMKEDLNPYKYGVIVSSGHKRGLLLPDLEGVDTVDEQLSIALQKAGILPNEKYEIERFEVKRYT